MEIPQSFSRQFYLLVHKLPHIQIIPHLFLSLYMVCTQCICTCLNFVHAFSNRADSLLNATMGQCIILAAS